jgi:hypothetical protein
MGSPDSGFGISADPLDAMALAPAEALIEPKSALPAAQPTNASAGEKTNKEGAKSSPSKAGSTKPTCGESVGEAREGDCIRGRVARVGRSRAVNERPLIAAAPIGHWDDPAVLPAPASAPVEDIPSPAAQSEKPSAVQAPTETAVAEATPADAAPAAEPTSPAPAPSVSSKKSRPRVHHVRNESSSGRRSNYSYRSSYSSGSSVYLQGGYGRLW